MRRFWRTKHLGRSAENTDPPIGLASLFQYTDSGEDTPLIFALTE